MIDFGQFTTHSGLSLPWKINCDTLSYKDIEDLAKIINSKLIFGIVYGIPRGGMKLANALNKYTTEGPVLIVDDVLTTGNSFIEARKLFNTTSIGIVIFSRGECPDWVHPIFTVNQWFQK